MNIQQAVNSSIMVGDELQINTWGDRFTVAAVSPGFILAGHGTEYTIIQRTPTDYGPYNGIPEGAIVCGPDWWTFGEQYKEVMAGNDMKMGCGYPERLLEAKEKGAVTREAMETAAKHILTLILRMD